MTINYVDPNPARFSAIQWHRHFSNFPPELIDKYRYYHWAGKTSWNTYLQPPTSFVIYGARYLKKLTYDNSLASLRLWGFMLNESERLYRAKQMGKKVVAVMGDLGVVPILAWSFPNLVPFYPDCQWWTPFLNESQVLFDDAQKLGLNEDCCYVRAALGTFAKRAYFPDPDICIASIGASCNDMSSVIKLVHRHTGLPFHYIDLPYRRDGGLQLNSDQSIIFNGDTVTKHSFEHLVREFQEVIAILEKVSGYRFDMGRFQETLYLTNRLRKNISVLNDLVYTSQAAALPALEMMNVEFMALSGYGDLEEAVEIMDHLVETANDRVIKNIGVLNSNAIPIAWINPSADPLLLCRWEDMGGRIVATEYVIRQALVSLPKDGEPSEIAAYAMLNGSLIGSSHCRAQTIINEARCYKAKGAIISGIFGSSHCAVETWLIRDEMAKSLNIPVLTFNVVGPGRANQQEQVHTRMEALMESINANEKAVINA